MKKTELIKRYILFVISLFFVALGIAVTRKGEMGVSPISSVANVFSYKYTDVSLGTWLIIWNCILLVGQIILMRRNFQLIQLLQIPVSFIFGYFTDLGMWCVSFYTPHTYVLRIINVVIGTVIIGFGVSLAVIADVIMNSGEAFVKALASTYKKEFGFMKTVFDITCVILAVIFSFIFFGFKIVGTREGTLIAALFTGVTVKFFCSKISEPILKFIK